MTTRSDNGDHREDGKSRIDAAVGSVLDSAGQKMSRRGILVKLGKVCLAALGVTVFEEVLPYTRAVAGATHYAACGDRWFLCNLWGRWCACDSCSGSLYSCPGCARVGGSWTACCCCDTQDPQDAKYVRYIDCFQGDCSNAKKEGCRQCHECANGQPRGYYDGSEPYYLCTKIRVTSDSC